MLKKGKHNHNNLEELLHNEASNFVLYPKDTLWEDIQTEIHGTPKWPALTFFFLCIVVALTITTALNYPPKPINSKYIVTQNILLPNTYVQNKKITPFIQQLDTKKNNEETFANGSNIQMDNEIENQILALPSRKLYKESENTLATINLKTKTFHDDVLINEERFANDFYANINLINQNLDKAEVAQTSIAPVLKQNLHVKFEGDENYDPTVDSYLNEFKANKTPIKIRTSKWKYQVYATPSVSDRILYDDKERIYFTQPNTVASQSLKEDVNDVITYKPAMGTEIGVSFMYKVAKNLHVKGGVQFNIRQYSVDAYRGFGIATFAFVNNNSLDSINKTTVFGNTKTNFKTELNNKLYELSVPIGLQWNFLKAGNFGMNIGATIQPTFSLNKNIYAISTDYKYYADGEPFFRKWNLNSSAELNFTFTQGNKQWFFGPQIRYQHLPTFNKIYPIKEFRLDYGIKFGIITNF